MSRNPREQAIFDWFCNTGFPLPVHSEISDLLRAIDNAKMPRVLHLNVRQEYFDEIRAGTKTEEYREATTRWTRLLKDPYDEINIYLGYPKKGDMSRTIRRKFNGYTFKTITHKHFGTSPVGVYAIDLTKEIE